MGIRDWFGPRRPQSIDVVMAAQTPEIEIAVAADYGQMMDISQTYNDRNITFTGDLAGFNYNTLLRDKQTNINSFYQLADYWVDADPLFRGAIKEVYVPFSLIDDFRLVGGSEQTRQKYTEYFNRIGMWDKLESFFLQYYLYANLYISVQPDGDIISLPPHLCRIGNIRVNKQPIVEFNCRTLQTDLRRMGNKAYKKFIEDEDLEKRLSGYPPEVAMGLRNNREWVQLNPRTTFVLQDAHPDWQRYAIPMVAACLKAFAKKELIGAWEDALLNLAARSFVHVKYGSPEKQVIPDKAALTKLQALFASAMTASNKVALAVTNNFADAKVIQPESDHIFDHDKYAGVNADILSAAGISGIVVSGQDNAASFGSSQVSTKMVALRIQEAKRRMAQMMNEIIAIGLNGTKNGLPRSASNKLPKFTFPVTDLTNNKSFQDRCLELWNDGVLSYETMIEAHGFDYEEEKARKQAEVEEEVQTKVFVKPGVDPDSLQAEPVTNDNSSGDNPVGRPKMSDDERQSDPADASTGAQPKPSNEEGTTNQGQM